MSQIINGDAPITYDTALNLESVLGVSATFWNNYEAKYRENLKRIEEAKKLESEQSVLENIPYRKMIKKGWIEKGKDKALIALSCRGKKWDSFWFNFFHELAHIMKHRKKELFINAEETANMEIEEEANNIAKNLLIPNSIFKTIAKSPTKENVLSLRK